jgi:hypothetical protein
MSSTITMCATPSLGFASSSTSCFFFFFLSSFFFDGTLSEVEGLTWVETLAMTLPRSTSILCQETNFELKRDHWNEKGKEDVKKK